MIGEFMDWEFLVEYDVIDGVMEVWICVFNNMLQEYEVNQLYIGSDIGLSYFYVDGGFTNGMVYYYVVMLYDYQLVEYLEWMFESL